MGNGLKISIVVCLLGAAVGLISCSTVPETGRRQLNLVDEEKVVAMTKGAFEQMKRAQPISMDPSMNEALTRVGYKLSQLVFHEMPLAEWEFVVFDVPNEINAFAMPGGKIGVYSGLFNLLVENEDQLASVIAHEVAHVTAKHTHEKISQGAIAKGGGNVLGVAGGLGGMILGPIYGMNAQGAISAWDRAKESEADRIGLMYMAKVGYNPEAAIKVMEKMVALDGGAGQRPWYATHPSSQERLDILYSYLGEAMVHYEAYQNRKEEAKDQEGDGGGRKFEDFK